MFQFLINEVTTVSFVIQLIIVLAVFIVIQSWLESKRKIAVPGPDAFEQDHEYVNLHVPKSRWYTPLQEKAQNIKDSPHLLTDGRFLLVFNVRKDLITIGRVLTLLNAVFMTEMIHWFLDNRFHPIQFTVLFLLCLFQVSYWVYYWWTPVTVLVFDRETKKVYIPRYGDNPPQVVPFNAVEIFYIPSLLGGDIMLFSKNLTVDLNRIQFRIPNPQHEVSKFSIYHRPPKVLMRYHYREAADHLGAIFGFMQSENAAIKTGDFQSSVAFFNRQQMNLLAYFNKYRYTPNL